MPIYLKTWNMQALQAHGTERVQIFELRAYDNALSPSFCGCCACIRCQQAGGSPGAGGPARQCLECWNGPGGGSECTWQSQVFAGPLTIGAAWTFQTATCARLASAKPECYCALVALPGDLSPPTHSATHVALSTPRRPLASHALRHSCASASFEH